VTPTPVYEAYGSMTYGAAVAQYGFGGQFGYYIDPETGLVLCGQRYYDPGAARWLTRDPLGYAGGVNLYAYCGNNPIGAADPDGTSPWWDNFFSARSPTMVDAQDLEMQYEMAKLDHNGDAGIAAAVVNASWNDELCRRQQNQHNLEISGAAIVGAAIVGSAAVAAYSVPATLYHFTSAAGAAGIAAAGEITASTGLAEGGGAIFGSGVYASAPQIPIIATLMGASSTEAVVPISTQGLTVYRTLIPGAFRIIGNVPIR